MGTFLRCSSFKNLIDGGGSKKYTLAQPQLLKLFQLFDTNARLLKRRACC